MLDKNLYSINKFQEEIKAAKLFSCLLSTEQRAEIKEIDHQLSHMTHLIESFNRIFSDLGWCSYDSMNMPLMEKAISDYEKDGIEAGERVLVEYYKTDVKGMGIYFCCCNAFMSKNLL